LDRVGSSGRDRVVDVRLVESRDSRGHRACHDRLVLHSPVWTLAGVNISLLSAFASGVHAHAHRKCVGSRRRRPDVTGGGDIYMTPLAAAERTLVDARRLAVVYRPLNLA
jgi:hypothetical protein